MIHKWNPLDTLQLQLECQEDSMPTESIWNLTVMHWLVYGLHVVCDFVCFPRSHFLQVYQYCWNRV